MKRLAVVLAIAFPAVRAYADSATAAAAFKQAEDLRKKGKWEQACPLYQASYEADPQLGALLNLADCHEHIGKTATAWAEFNDAADLARSKNDPREARIRKKADALAGKLAKLRINAPKTAIAGMTVKRDTTDVTILVGADVPIDPGPHEIVVTAPGYVDWKSQVTIAPSATQTIDIPALEKVPTPVVVTPPPERHEGKLKITTQADAEILFDGQKVGDDGVYEATIKSGGHTLRVTAPHMRPYQTEVVVADNEARVIDVPLEKEAAASTTIVMPAAPAGPKGPAFELGASLGTGVKLRNDNPLIVTLRAEAALRLGTRVNLGVFAEYGSIDTQNACGFDMPGPMPTSDFDFGPRNQFTSCTWVMPGLQLYVHALPGKPIDPYFGLAPGFKFGFTNWVPYDVGVAGAEKSEFFPAIVIGARAGVNYHPKPGLATWEVGAFVELAVTAIGDEAADDPFSRGDGGGKTFVSLFGGLRTSLAF